MTVVAFPRREGLENELDVLCFSHLRWDFVFQRPQHLMQRFAAHGRVFFIEEPVETDGRSYIDVSKRGNNVFVCVPNLNRLENSDVATVMAGLIDEMCGEWKIENYINWFYTPMMLGWSGELHPRAIIYDCMDELSGFKGRLHHCASAKGSCFPTPTWCLRAAKAFTKPRGCSILRCTHSPRASMPIISPRR